jgi:hypothetical protein
MYSIKTKIKQLKHMEYIARSKSKLCDNEILQESWEERANILAEIIKDYEKLDAPRSEGEMHETNDS